MRKWAQIVGSKFIVPENSKKICGCPYLFFKATVKVSRRSDTRTVRAGSASDSEYSGTFDDPKIVKIEYLKCTVVN